MTRSYGLIIEKYRRSRMRSVLVTVLSYIIAIVVVYVNTGEDRMSSWFFPATMGVVALMVFAGLWQRLRAHRLTILSYRLILDDEGISREQYSTQPVSISYNGIVTIIQTRGGLIVKGIDPGETIQIRAGKL